MKKKAAAKNVAPKHSVYKSLKVYSFDKNDKATGQTTKTADSFNIITPDAQTLLDMQLWTGAWCLHPVYGYGIVTDVKSWGVANLMVSDIKSGETLYKIPVKTVDLIYRPNFFNKWVYAVKTFFRILNTPYSSIPANYPKPTR